MNAAGPRIFLPAPRYTRIPQDLVSHSGTGPGHAPVLWVSPPHSVGQHPTTSSRTNTPHHTFCWTDRRTLRGHCRTVTPGRGHGSAWFPGFGFPTEPLPTTHPPPPGGATGGGRHRQTTGVRLHSLVSVAHCSTFLLVFPHARLVQRGANLPPVSAVVVSLPPLPVCSSGTFKRCRVLPARDWNLPPTLHQHVAEPILPPTTPGPPLNRLDWTGGRQAGRALGFGTSPPPTGGPTLILNGRTPTLLLPHLPHTFCLPPHTWTVVSGAGHGFPRRPGGTLHLPLLGHGGPQHSHLPRLQPTPPYGITWTGGPPHFTVHHTPTQHPPPQDGFTHHGSACSWTCAWCPFTGWVGGLGLPPPPPARGPV